MVEINDFLDRSRNHDLCEGYDSERTRAQRVQRSDPGTPVQVTGRQTIGELLFQDVLRTCALRDDSNPSGGGMSMHSVPRSFIPAEAVRKKRSSHAPIVRKPHFLYSFAVPSIEGS